MTKSKSADTARSGSGAARSETVETGAGTARITWHPARKARLVLAVSHGAGGGIEARDLQAIAAELPAHGVTVALVEQPWRVAGKKVAPAPKTLDVGWRGLWPALTKPGLPVIAGGRSAGARVACRTAGELGAAAVLALSFPLHPSPSSRLRSSRGGPNGKPEKSRADELLGAGVPTLVVQGGNDPFGKPAEFPADGAYELVEIPFGDHSFAVPKRADIGQDEAVKRITDAVVRWAGMLGA
ncbi:alpha/beta hydrolase family protein [Streptomyces flavofungini]|uniref:alpha/beta hydrolase family protein n=1 Tax=Streptomyces flavofungini TaxID=68200 RepID=UPI0025B0A8BA|nr:alpha/beta family hydrolase [Streptomyces flavofungini]WJV46291.1 hydrolase [Streptomyces flavofungini]